MEKTEPSFFSGYVMYICKMNQPRIALEYHQENCQRKWFHSNYVINIQLQACVLWMMQALIITY